jgi:hypothetical protein
MFKDTKAIQIEERQTIQWSKEKRTNIDLQNTTQKTNVRATRTSLKTWSELRCFGRVSTYCSNSDTRRVTVKRHGLTFKIHVRSKILSVEIVKEGFPMKTITDIVCSNSVLS